MAAPVSVREVAERAGVAVGTVSNVLNHPDKVASATRERVQAAIDDLGFVRNDAARQLRNGRSRSIGMITLDAHDASSWARCRGDGVIAKSQDFDEPCRPGHSWMSRSRRRGLPARPGRFRSAA